MQEIEIPQSGREPRRFRGIRLSLPDENLLPLEARCKTGVAWPIVYLSDQGSVFVHIRYEMEPPSQSLDICFYAANPDLALAVFVEFESQRFSELPEVSWWQRTSDLFRQQLKQTRERFLLLSLDDVMSRQAEVAAELRSAMLDRGEN